MKDWDGNSGAEAPANKKADKRASQSRRKSIVFPPFSWPHPHCDMLREYYIIFKALSRSIEYVSIEYVSIEDKRGISRNDSDQIKRVRKILSRLPGWEERLVRPGFNDLP